MNVQQMIAALQQLDPNTPAGDAVKAVRLAHWVAETQKLMTKEGIVAAYPSVLARVASAKDSKGNTNADAKLEAFNSIRSMVHEALQHFNPTPLAEELEPVVASLKSEVTRSKAIHEIQKAHGIELWEKADALVAAAGITAEGGA